MIHQQHDLANLSCTGPGLRGRMEQALVMAVENQIAFEELHDGLSVLRSEDIKSWGAMMDAYEVDRTKPCPYIAPRTGKSPH